MSATTTLALFPLETVLFPGCLLDLQIFEARYLDMVGRCLKRGEGFGVVGLLEGREVGRATNRLADTGCEALIRDWQQQPNGLLGIRVEGQRRFRVEHSQVHPDQSRSATVTWLGAPPDPPLADDHADLAALLATLAEHPLVRSLGLAEPADGQQTLANRLAYLLPFSLEQKAQLLALDDPRQSLSRIQQWLSALQG